jgi:hypothetical protein
LWQFIETSFPQNLADGSISGVVLQFVSQPPFLFHCRISLQISREDLVGINYHRTEFPYAEVLARLTDPAVTVETGSSGCDPDEEPQDGQERQKQDANGRNHTEVKKPFHDSRTSAGKVLPNGDAKQIADTAGVGLHPCEAFHIPGEKEAPEAAILLND